jgi:hypothetical protein
VTSVETSQLDRDALAPRVVFDTARAVSIGFLGAVFLAILSFVAFGFGEAGTHFALRITARFAFIFFWLAYVGSGLAALAGRSFLPLKRSGREFGLAFASAELVHLGLVVWLAWIGFPPSRGLLLVFGTAMICVFLLALFSIARLQKLIGPMAWRLMRVLGMNYIALAFAKDFLRITPQFSVAYLAEYMPFVVLNVIGPILYFVPLILAVRSRTISDKR